MMRTIQWFHPIRHSFHNIAEQFITAHPSIAFLCMFFMVPLILVAAILVSTTAILFPIAGLLGWL